MPWLHLPAWHIYIYNVDIIIIFVDRNKFNPYATISIWKGFTSIFAIQTFEDLGF